jgi:hypothetical protein
MMNGKKKKLIPICTVGIRRKYLLKADIVPIHATSCTSTA